MELISLGGGNYINASRLVALVSPDSLPVRRLVQDAKNAGRMIDVSGGKKTRSVLITDSEHIICCAEETSVLQEKLNSDRAAE
ncbi:MAG: DUF370 domain-containing protein [Clostridia bacterium]|nr:DUF370 domain-containing protein [Clostridia bacterium]MBO7158589.1 DUF370 domain-containing protein [Clostridia bacterium]MBQ1254402.1 DUF370 domain-containing protein [Clostridia bacterium]MBQ2254743.1 DUF370 domain-containing protein [Clostridia bacterium]MBQ5791583.1 DUF370 domain-containing protein [Clostridia bacterium]